MGFIDQPRSEGYAAWSILRVLREQGVEVVARPYRAWRAGRVAARTVTDALVGGAVRDAVSTTVTDAASVACRKMTPEGPYGRKKMTAFIRRTAIDDASRGAADRPRAHSAYRAQLGPRRSVPTIPAKDGIRAGDLLNCDFTTPRPDHTWVTDFTNVRTWAGWVYVAFILDVFSQRIVAWHAQTSEHVDLSMTPLCMALWERDRQGHTVGLGQLRHHGDAGFEYISMVLAEHHALEQIAPSIGSVGDAYDNALMGTINGVYKAECVRATRLPRRHVQDARGRRVRDRRMGRLVQPPQALR